MSTPFDAQVIAAFGRHVIVRDTAGREHKARPFGRKLVLVCGDKVRCEADGEEVHVVELLPRDSALYRSNLRGGAEAIVANLTHVIVVLAPRPSAEFFVVDRYVCAATSAAIAATLVVNKSDLGVDAGLRAELDAYAAAGYQWIECSAHADVGMERLREICSQSVSVLVGQSGVGKSSLARRLIPEAEIAVGELDREHEGRHTTTASRLFDLPRGGALIDSPGVRDFAPAIDRLEASSLGFIEVARLAPDCRFQDCKHIREPGCAVLKAAESGRLHPRRYESYRRLRRLFEELTEARGPVRNTHNRR